MKGLIHIYCGDGKGKTTAATGLAIRGAGYGMKVTFVQFLKDGSSSEFNILNNIDNINIIICKKKLGFSWNMNEEIKVIAKEEYTKLLEKGINEALERKADMIVFDEIMSAISCGFVLEENLIKFLKEKPEELEVILTGRNPSKDLVEIADYVSEIKKIKHPFDCGIASREGIEY